MTLYVGTSGYAYPEWKPDFYPPGVKQADFLAHYASQLSACEINATFYRLQRPETFERWRDSTPDEFRFAVKAHRRLTHGKSIAPKGVQRDFLDTFLKSLQPLDAKLGVVLFQLPPYRKKDTEGLRALLELVPEGRIAFEFRDTSWNDPDVSRAIEERGGTLCLADTSGEAPAALPSGRIAYLRLRHERYTDEQRRAWREILTREGESRDVYSFAKHEGVPAGDPYTGVGFAVWLREQTASTGYKLS